MDVAVSVLWILSHLTVKVICVPSQICFDNFRWEDCGMPPKPVIYYYKPGSRCEVGFWRGCLPNRNMFVDEYECVNTCIFTERVSPEDYHKPDIEPQHHDEYETTEGSGTNTTTTDVTEDGSTDETGNNGAGSSATTQAGGGDGSDATQPNGEETTPASA